MLMTERSVRTIVAQEQYQRILGDAQFVEMVQEVAQRFIHPLDQLMIETRVGEQTLIAWKLFKRIPSSARRCMLGVR